MDTQRSSYIVLAYARSHQQQRLSAKNDSLFGLGRADNRFDCLTLRERERERLSPRPRVRS